MPFNLTPSNYNKNIIDIDSIFNNDIKFSNEIIDLIKLMLVFDEENRASWQKIFEFPLINIWIFIKNFIFKKLFKSIIYTVDFIIILSHIKIKLKLNF